MSEEIKRQKTFPADGPELKKQSVQRSGSVTAAMFDKKKKLNAEGGKEQRREAG